MLNSAKLRDILGWFFVALFFCYQYILRVTPGVISSDLRQHFHLTAEEFSSLGSFYLYAYAILQIPVGFVVDRVGIKRSVLFSLLLCVAGTALITQTQSLLVAQFSRILVGAGSACAFMSALKWIADHFDPGQRGLLLGATLSIGTVGALSAGFPLVRAVEAFGWEEAVLFTGVLGIILWAVIFFFLSDNERHKKNEVFNFGKILKDLKEIVSNKTIVIYSFLAIGVYTPLAVVADLWGVSFLIERFAISRADAALTTMLMYLGLAIGCLILPAFAERKSFFTQSVQVCSLALLILFSIILFVPFLPLLVLQVIFLLIGFFCGAEMICFSGALVGSSPRTSGLTIGFVNTMNMLGGAFMQQIIGHFLDLQWQGNVDQAGVRMYNAEQYVYALVILPIVLFVCVVVSMKLNKRDFNTNTLSTAV